MLDTSTAPQFPEGMQSLAEWRKTCEALADWLNEQHPTTWGELKQLLDIADTGNTGVHLESRRMRWGGTRALFAFTPIRRFRDGDIPEDELPKVSYLYDDTVTSGASLVSNLKRVARWEA